MHVRAYEAKKIAASPNGISTIIASVCRRWAQRLHTLAMIVLIPLGLAAIFLASYALTCILNGASPSEVLEHLAALGQRLGDVVTTIRAGWES